MDGNQEIEVCDEIKSLKIDWERVSPRVSLIAFLNSIFHIDDLLLIRNQLDKIRVIDNTALAQDSWITAPIAILPRVNIVYDYDFIEQKKDYQ